MKVSLSDFSNNIELYTQTAARTPLTVEKDGEPYFSTMPAVRIMTKEEKIAALKRVVGIFPSDLDFDKIKTEAILGSGGYRSGFHGTDGRF